MGIFSSKKADDNSMPSLKQYATNIKESDVIVPTDWLTSLLLEFKDYATDKTTKFSFPIRNVNKQKWEEAFKDIDIVYPEILPRDYIDKLIETTPEGFVEYLNEKMSDDEEKLLKKEFNKILDLMMKEDKNEIMAILTEPKPELELTSQPTSEASDEANEDPKNIEPEPEKFKTDKDKIEDQVKLLMRDNELLDQQQEAIVERQKAIVERQKAIVEKEKAIVEKEKAIEQQRQNNKVLLDKLRVLEEARAATALNNSSIEEVPNAKAVEVLIEKKLTKLTQQNNAKTKIEAREKRMKETEAKTETDAEEKFFSSHSDVEDAQEEKDKKSKKKSKRKVRIRESPPPDPDSSDDEDDDDDKDDDKAGRKMKQKQNKDTASSVASSMFGDLADKIVGKLMDITAYVKTNLEAHSEKKIILEALKAKINETLTYVQKKCDKANDGEIDNEQQETITDLISDLRTLETEVILKLNIIDEIRVQKSYQPKQVYPIFSGIPSSFLTWSQEIDEMTKNMPDSQRITIYKKQIQGKKRDEILKLIDTETDYDEVKRLMGAKFGNLDTLLPSLEAEIRNLRAANNANDETENIYQMLNFFKILTAHGKLSECSIGMLNTMKNKLRKFRTEYLDINFPASPKLFQERIEEFLNANFRNALIDGNHENKSGSGGASGNPPYKGRASGYGYSTKTNKTNFEKFCTVCKSSEHETFGCSQLKNKSLNELKDILKKSRSCFTCLKPYNSSHDKSKCERYYSKKYQKYINRNCKNCNINRGICPCSKSRVDGGSLSNNTQQPTTPPPTTASNSVRSSQQYSEICLNNGSGIGTALTPCQVVTVVRGNQKKRIVVSFDNNSQNCIIDTSLKEFLFDVKETYFGLETVTNRELKHGSVGRILLEANNKQIEIGGIVQSINMKSIRQHKVLVPQKWQNEYNLKDIETTCSGKLSLIIGSDCLQWFPKSLDTFEGIELQRSRIDNSCIIYGFNKNRVFPVQSGDKNISAVNRISLHPLDESFLKVMNPSIFETIECDKCNDSTDTSRKSKLQQHEENLIRSSLKFDEEKGQFCSKLPEKKEIENIPTYFEPVKKWMESLRAKLLRSSDGQETATKMNKTFNDNIEAGKFVFQSEMKKKYPEIDKLPHTLSPCNYVRKPSNPKKVRTVFNYSFHQGEQPSINQCWLTGTSLNENICNVLLRSRGYCYRATSDIDAFYNQVLISPEDSCRHAFLWKKGGILSDGQWEVVYPTVAMFGACYSQCLANAAKLEANEMFIRPVSEEAAEHVEKSSYTDDLEALAQNKADLETMIEVIEQGMQKGHFPLKKWVRSHEKSSEKLMVPGSSTNLGLGYDSEFDTMNLKPNLNFFEKVRGIRPENKTLKTPEEMEAFILENGLTKKQLLMACHFTFDPLLLFISLKSNLSLLYRQFLQQQPHLKWEDKVDPSILPDWIAALKQVYEVTDIAVPRAAVPPDIESSDEVSLVVACDGGSSSSVSRAFLRVKPKNSDKYLVTYLIGTYRLGDLNHMGSIKTEIIALLKGCKLIEQITKVLKHLKFDNIYILSDSRVCLGALESFSSKLKLYFSHRTVFCQNIIQKYNVKVMYVKSAQNPGNYGSKLNLKTNDALDPEYWCPSFLTKPESEWGCVKYSFEDKDIKELYNPKLKLLNSTKLLKTQIYEHFLSELFCKYSKFKAIQNILAYVILFIHQKMKKQKTNYVSCLQEAENYLFNLMNPTKDQAEGLKRQYKVIEKSGGVYLITRLFATEDKPIQKYLRLLNGKTKLAQKYLNSVHVHCCSSERELTKLFENNVYVTGARTYLKNLQYDCITCRKIRKVAEKAECGPSFQELSSKNEIFSRSQIDIKGPVKLRLTRNKSQKGWICGLTCSWSRLTVLCLLTEMSSNALLKALKTICYQYGAALPKILHSDMGTNIVTLKNIDENKEFDSGKFLRNMKNTFEREKIELVLSSASSPNRQALIERLWRNYELNMKRTNFYGKTYSITDWQYILAFQSFLLNSRPLNIRYSGENLLVLTSFKLLMGQRNNVYPANLDMNISENNLYKKLFSLETELEAWKNLWMKTYLQDIYKFTVFQSKTKDLKVGDCVYVLDHFNPTNKYNSLATVEEVISERTYKLKYVKKEAIYDKSMKLVTPAKFGYLLRPKQKLCFLFTQIENSENHVDPYSADPDVDQIVDIEQNHEVENDAVDVVGNTPNEEMDEPTNEIENVAADLENEVENIEDEPEIENELMDELANEPTANFVNDFDLSNDNLNFETPKQTLKVNVVFDKNVEKVEDRVKPKAKGKKKSKR